MIVRMLSEKMRLSFAVFGAPITLIAAMLVPFRRSVDARRCRRQKNCFSWQADPLEPKILLSGEIRTLSNVDFVFDKTRVSRIFVNNKNVLTGGGIYLIGSTSGADNDATNYKSIGATDGRMVASRGGQIGPKFELKFGRLNANQIQFAVSVTANQDFEKMSLAFDWDKSEVTRFRIPGTKLKFIGTGQDGWHSGTPVPGREGTRWYFKDIPQHHVVPGTNGQREGTALTRNVAEMGWVRLSGPRVKIKVELNTLQGVKDAAFTNHFAANASGYGFGPLRKGETAKIEGVITVTAR